MKTSGYKKFSRRSTQNGIAAIEFTIMLPFLLLMIFATAEFGRMLYQYNALNTSVRDATRYLISNASPGTTGLISVTTQVQSNVEKLVKYGDLNTSAPLLPNLEASTITLTINGEFLTINVSYPWQPIFFNSLPTFGQGSNIDLSFPLVSTYTMRAL